LQTGVYSAEDSSLIVDEFGRITTGDADMHTVNGALHLEIPQESSDQRDEGEAAERLARCASCLCLNVHAASVLR
jgi:hypothetical protein